MCIRDSVFPFLKYATDLMVQKYNVDTELAGTIPSLLQLGTLFLTPLFGNVYDLIGKGATLMIIGSVLLIFVHTMFALPVLNVWWFATIIMICLLYTSPQSGRPVFCRCSHYIVRVIRMMRNSCPTISVLT